MMSDEPKGQQQEDFGPPVQRNNTAVGFAHVLQVLQIVFMLGIAVAFYVTREEVDSLRAEYRGNHMAMDVRMSVAEKSLAQREREDHDLSEYLRNSLEKINTALNNLRTDLAVQALKRR